MAGAKLDPESDQNSQVDKTLKEADYTATDSVIQSVAINGQSLKLLAWGPITLEGQLRLDTKLSEKTIYVSTIIKENRAFHIVHANREKVTYSHRQTTISQAIDQTARNERSQSIRGRGDSTANGKDS